MVRCRVVGKREGDRKQDRHDREEQHPRAGMDKTDTENFCPPYYGVKLPLPVFSFLPPSQVRKVRITDVQDVDYDEHKTRAAQ